MKFDSSSFSIRNQLKLQVKWEMALPAKVRFCQFTAQIEIQFWWPQKWKCRTLQGLSNGVKLIEFLLIFRRYLIVLKWSISWKWQPTGRLFSKYSGGRGLLHLFGPSTTRAGAVEESSRPPHPGTLEHVHSPVVWNLPTVNTFVFVVGDSSFTSANPPHPLLSTSATKFAKNHLN